MTRRSNPNAGFSASVVLASRRDEPRSTPLKHTCMDTCVSHHLLRIVPGRLEGFSPIRPVRKCATIPDWSPQWPEGTVRLSHTPLACRTTRFTGYCPMPHRLLSLSLQLRNRPSPDSYRERPWGIAASNIMESSRVAASNIYQRTIFSARRSIAQSHQPDRAGRSRWMVENYNTLKCL